jgi:hypothetical protein
MGIPLTKYKNIKDKCCLVYLGHSEEYLTQIKYLIPYIEKEFLGIEIHVCCKPEFAHIFENRCFSQNELRDKKQDFGHFIEIKSNLNSHPILQFLDESKIPYGPADIKMQEHPTIKCAICPNGSTPVKSLTQDQIQKISIMAKKEGMSPEITDQVNDAGWVIGVENASLYRASSKGIRTTLIPTGLGTKLFKTLFPNGEILEL